MGERASSERGPRRRGDRWVGALAWLLLPLLVAVAPALVILARARRWRLGRLDARAEGASLRVDARGVSLVRGDERVSLTPGDALTLWELYAPGGFASNDELARQLLVVRTGGRARVFSLREPGYGARALLRSRGLRVRARHHAPPGGALTLLAGLGALAWLVTLALLVYK
ncbi:MAG: hypothetical protein H6713_25145 [Myxococcales bacterium]|nr:hypothetical protein [Myxococcales bacterium]